MSGNTPPYLRNQPIGERVIWYAWIAGVTAILAYVGRWWGLLAVGVWLTWSIVTEGLARSLTDLARAMYEGGDSE